MVALEFNPAGIADIYDLDRTKASRIRKSMVKTPYKENIIDKIYKKIYIDLTNLPLSVM